MEHKNCVNCVLHVYEENDEEVEVLVCILRRKRIENPQQAATCPNFYRGNDE